MDHLRIFLGLLCLVAGVAAIAARFRQPLPIVLVLAGQIIAFVPGLPHIALKPDMVLIGFLPPLIFAAAYAFPWEEFRSNFHTILWLAVGLVLMTVLSVGLAAYWMIPGMTLAAGFVLGAIVSPPDAVAASAIFQRLRVPQRASSILEGESLVNDSSGLIAYHFAVAAVVTGVFSFSAASVSFVWGTVGGVVIGLVVGLCTALLQRMSGDAAIHIILSILSPYFAYLISEHVDASGVIAVVALGLYLGRRASKTLSSASRLQMQTVWNFATYLMNGAIFILIGLQLPHVVRNIGDFTVADLTLYSVVTCLVVVGVRFGWIMLLGNNIKRVLPPNLRRRASFSHGVLFLFSWSGMRGVVSLAAAMAIPMMTSAGEEFPCRNLIIFLTFVVISFTLMVQGCTLPWLVRKLKLSAPPPNYAKEMEIRSKLTTLALEKLEQECEKDPELREHAFPQLKAYYLQMTDLFRKRSQLAQKDPEKLLAEEKLYVRLVNDVRNEIVTMRDQGKIDESTARKLEREMDLLQERNELMMR